MASSIEGNFDNLFYLASRLECRQAGGKIRIKSIFGNYVIWKGWRKVPPPSLSLSLFYAKLILCEAIGCSTTRIAFDPCDNVHVYVTEKRFVINSAAKIAFILSMRIPKEKYVEIEIVKRSSGV